MGEPVLILIVMDNGLSPLVDESGNATGNVLILIVMDNGLSHGNATGDWGMCDGSLNPYCNG